MMSVKKASNFLDSDSDSVRSFGSEDSSDESLPKYNICTPEKRQRTQSSTSSNGVLTRTPGSHQLSTPSANLVSIGAQSRQGSITITTGTSKKQFDFPVTLGQSSTHGSSSSDRTVRAPASVSSHLLSPSRASGCGRSLVVNGSSSHLSTSSCTSTTASLGFHSPTRVTSLAVSPSNSPMQLSERHGKTLQQYNKLTRKMADIKSRMEKTSKLEAYRLSGGIRGLSSGAEKTTNQSVSSEHDEETSTSSLMNVKPGRHHKEDDKFPLPVHPPGLPLLVHPAVLLSTLTPPMEAVSDTDFNAARSATKEGAPPLDSGRDQKLMEDSGFLHHLICNRWFVMEYASKPCPLHIWKWLFEVSCKSCEVSLGELSLTNLTSLLEIAQQADHESWPVFVPSTSAIIDVLVALGADREKLRLERLVKGRLLDNGPSQRHESLSVTVAAGLANLFTYLNKFMQCRPSEMTPDDALHVVLLTAAISLDSALLQLHDTGLARAMTNVLSSLFDSVPEDSWPEWCGKVSSSLLTLSSHHHDCVHICDIILSSSRRSEEIRKHVIRRQLSSVIFPGNSAAIDTISSTSDWKLTWRVVKFYYDKISSSFDYYAMCSSMSLLGMLQASTVETDWPSREEADVKYMLSDLGLVRIKDDVDRVDKVPVKELFICFKLEMESRKRSKSLRQSNLFDYC